MATPKKLPVGLLLFLVVFLFIATNAVFFLGLAWRNRLTDFRSKQAQSNHVEPTLEFARDRLALIDRHARQPQVDPREIRTLAEFASAKLDEALRIDPENAEIHMLLGRLLEMEHRLDEALAEYGKSLDLQPELNPAGYHRGLLGLRMVFRRRLLDAKAGKDTGEQAIADLRKFNSFWPGWERKATATTTVAYLFGKREEAAKIAVGAIAFDETNWMTRFVASLAANDAGQAQIASTIYPYAPEPHALLGHIFAGEKRWIDARLSFERAVELDPFFVEAYVRLSRLHAQDGRFDIALRYAEAALKVSPEAAQKELAHAAYETWIRGGRRDDALRDKAFQASDGLPGFRADILVHRGEFAAALLELSDPGKDSHLLRLRAQAHEGLGDWSSAEKDHNTLVDLSDDSLALLKRARFFARAKNFPTAFRDLDTLIELDPADTSARYAKATIQRLAGDLDGALKSSDEALSLNPRFARADLLRAEIYLERGETGAAIDAADEAIGSDPFLGEALLVRGDANLKQGNAEAARQDWEKAAAVKPALKEQVQERIRKL